MSGVSWTNLRRYLGALWAIAPARALVEGPARLAMAALLDATHSVERDPPVPRDTVLILGHQRSGTTWLHHMLASHPDASAMPLYAMVLPIDAVLRRLGRMARPDWLERWEQRRFAGLRDIHPFSLSGLEEDEFALWPWYRSPMNRLDRPWPRGLAPAIDHDAESFRLWVHTVGRSVARSGRRHVGKNPHFTPHVAELRRLLPDLRTVLVLRDPEEAIASRLSLIRAIWGVTRPGVIMEPHHVELIYQSSKRILLATAQGADVIVPYTDLVADPVGTVSRIHRQLGLPPFPDGVIPGLGQRSNARAHRYTLEEFGLDRARVREELAAVTCR